MNIENIYFFFTFVAILPVRLMYSWRRDHRLPRREYFLLKVYQKFKVEFSA